MLEFETVRASFQYLVSVLHPGQVKVFVSGSWMRGISHLQFWSEWFVFCTEIAVVLLSHWKLMSLTYDSSLRFLACERMCDG